MLVGWALLSFLRGYHCIRTDKDGGRLPCRKDSIVRACLLSVRACKAIVRLFKYTFLTLEDGDINSAQRSSYGIGSQKVAAGAPTCGLRPPVLSMNVAARPR